LERIIRSYEKRLIDLSNWWNVLIKRFIVSRRLVIERP